MTGAQSSCGANKRDEEDKSVKRVSSSCEGRAAYRQVKRSRTIMARNISTGLLSRSVAGARNAEMARAVRTACGSGRLILAERALVPTINHPLPQVVPTLFLRKVTLTRAHAELRPRRRGDIDAAKRRSARFII